MNGSGRLYCSGTVLADSWNGSCRLRFLDFSGTVLAGFLDFLEHFLRTFWTFWSTSCELSGFSDKSTSCGLSRLSGLFRNSTDGLSGLSDKFLL
ncbi:hypothetical protein C1645_881453 [Glomus cerebriforme]|uniref:Uncharacterized protein n=1 Tax=Glomus cerebriforme TaxID=658196 RepID=A0A397SA47_9GLOM|nr:hypothetical protein C1645_881453 [Glomus cerebriforme]